MPDPIRVGLIGYGLAGASFHAPLIRTTPGLRLEAIVSADPERAALALDRDPGARLLGDADELWDIAGELDLVVVASPNRTHVPLARAALRQGLAVVVDKPLAATAAEAADLVREAESLGRPFTVFQNRRWDGDFLTLHRLLERGALGAVHRFESRFERWRPTPRAGWRQRGDPAEAGGVLYDLGSHLIDQARVLFGPVDSVYAEVEQRRDGAEVDDDTFVALRHATGVSSHLWMGTVVPDARLRFRVLGSHAGYVKKGTDPQEEALREGRTPGERWGEEPRERWGRLGAGDDWSPVPTEPGAYPAFYAGLERALRGKGPLPVDPWDAVGGLEVIEAARESARTGTVIALERS